jgi:hypothetical protein
MKLDPDFDSIKIEQGLGRDLRVKYLAHVVRKTDLTASHHASGKTVVPRSTYAEICWFQRGP